MKPKIFFLKGLPGSGKTTRANEILKDEKNTLRINRDELRLMLFGKKWGDDLKKEERMVIDMAVRVTSEAIKYKKNVIWDSTNLNPTIYKSVKDKFGKKAVIEIVDLTGVPIDVCIERDKKRADSVGEAVIRDMSTKWLK